MNEKEFQKNEEIEIDLQRVFRAVMDHVWLVAVVAVICAVVTFAATYFFITPKYQSSAMFYVNNSNFPVGEASASISSGDLTVSRNLVDSYIVILNTRETLVDVIDYAGVSVSYSQLEEMISSESVNETEIFRVTVTSEDPEEAERLASAISYILPKRIGTIIDGTSAKVVDAAVVPTTPSSPGYMKNTIIGFLLGFALSIGVIALREIFDSTIRTEVDIVQTVKYPVLAAVPGMAAAGKDDGYCVCTSKYARKRKHSAVASGVSFAAGEAYKLLRTKLQFSFVDGNDGHVIGLSSALGGEGKSLTAVNLAHAMSQLDKKVLLVDCDMRYPALAEKTGLLKHPGLSDYLTGQRSLEDLVQVCQLKEGGESFDIITAGQNPSNPAELLGSALMKKALSFMRQNYDYVILDLPPIGEVADALVIAKETDGMLMVVRQNVCDRSALADAVCQLEFIRARTLGVVFNCAGEYSNNYVRGYCKRHCANGVADEEKPVQPVTQLFGVAKRK